MKKCTLLVWFFLFWNMLYGQNGGLSGLIFDDLRYDQIKIKSFDTGAKMSELPLKVNLKAYCPIPGNQGAFLSCVGWATGYGAMTIQYAIQQDRRDYMFLTKKAFSALFIYNQIKKGDCHSGATITDAMEFLMKNGNCYAKDFDRKIRDCEFQPSLPLKEWAQEQFAIKSYKTLFSIEEESANFKIIQIRKALADKKPVIVGLEVLRNFYELKKAKFWWPDVGNTTPAGGHAMVVIGYDEKKNAFQLLNSWGREWGDQGFIWIKYKDFAKYCKYGFVMDFRKEEQKSFFHPSEPKERQSIWISKPKENIDIEIKGAVQFLSYQKRGRKTGFYAAKVFSENGIYRSSKNWRVGQLFQLSIKMPERFSWLYVFSLENNGKTHIHKIERIESNLSNRSIIIPARNRALQLEEEGIDRLCLLFSKVEIKSFQKFMDEGLSNPINLKQDLKLFFKRDLVKQNAIFYSNQEINFALKEKTSGSIIPVILEVEGIR